MKMTREELIAYYSKQLEKVEAAYGNGCADAMGNEGAAYIEFARKNLEAVKNGREW